MNLPCEDYPDTLKTVNNPHFNYLKFEVVSLKRVWIPSMFWLFQMPTVSLSIMGDY